MSADVEPMGPSGGLGGTMRGIEIAAVGLSRTLKNGRGVLHDVSFTICRGELVAIVGGSGAGKTTLLEALAAVRRAQRVCVTFDGVDLYTHIAAFRGRLGYVPQDDIIHAELPLERTLRYAAKLRLAGAMTPQQVDSAVERAMAALHLSERASVRVGALSGGQRKRASIAVELLTRPQVFFLDEPSSGLDPATAAELLRLLRRLADAGSTVLLTTHAPQDLVHCDRVVFLARDGHLAFSGTIEAACRHFAVERVEQIYERLTEDTPEDWARRFEDGHGGGPEPPADVTGPRMELERGPTLLREWAVLSSRTFETLVRNRLTLAILIGSPLLVVAMIAVLFRRGAFEPTSVEPSAVAMILFWIAFGSFFFGLTYGLLQIVTERAILRASTSPASDSA